MATPVIHRDAAPRRTRPMQRWEPFRELEELHERALSVLDGAIADGGAVPWVPIADIEEDRGRLDRRGRAAGRQEQRHRRGRRRRGGGDPRGGSRSGSARASFAGCTRPVGRFELRVRIPGSIDAESVKAKLRDGVLTVRIPKASESLKRRSRVRVVITCPHCGRKNRVRAAPEGVPRCGNCQQLLLVVDATADTFGRRDPRRGARAGRLLGTVVRAVPDGVTGGGSPGPRARGPAQGRQAQRRHRHRHRRPVRRQASIPLLADQGC